MSAHRFVIKPKVKQQTGLEGRFVSSQLYRAMDYCSVPIMAATAAISEASCCS
jgi:hypothetical protein